MFRLFPLGADCDGISLPVPSAGGGSGGGSSGGGGLHEVPGSGGSSPAPPPGHWNPFDPKLGHVPVSGSAAGDQRVPGP